MTVTTNRSTTKSVRPEATPTASAKKTSAAEPRTKAAGAREATGTRAKNAVRAPETPSAFEDGKVHAAGVNLTTPEVVDAERQKWLDAFKDAKGVLPPKLQLKRVPGLMASTWREGKVPTRAELQKVMTKLRADESFAWPYIKDGCNARAHRISERFQDEKLNFRHMKLFIDDEGGKGHLKASNAFFGRNDFAWENHVVLAVAYTEKSGTGDVRFGIIDFAVSDEVLDPHDWLKRIGGEAVGVQIDLMPVTQYDKPTGSEGIQKWSFEEGLVLAHRRLEELSGKVKGLKPRHRQLTKQGSILDSFAPEAVQDAKGERVGWRFTEYPESAYNQVFLGGGHFTYQRRSEAEPTVSFIDRTGRPVPSLP